MDDFSEVKHGPFPKPNNGHYCCDNRLVFIGYSVYPPQWLGEPIEQAVSGRI